MSALNLSSVSGKAVLASTFSRGAYDSKTPFVPPPGFEPLRVVLENPQSPDFAASAYVNPKTGELVVAYRGSDSTTDLSAALQGAANGKWNGQFTDAAAFMKQAQGMAAAAVVEYAEQADIIDAPKITTLTTGHSLGGMLAQVVAKMYGVEAQVQDAPGAARLIDTPQFKQAAIANGQPESGHDITGKVQNVTTSNIAKLGNQFEETQMVAIPALGQVGGLHALATLGAFLANPVAGLATGTALQTAAEHSAVKIEDALHMLAGIKGQVADAGALTLQPIYLNGEGKPVAYAPADQGDAATRTTPIQALVDKGGKVVAFFDREVVDGEMQAVAVVLGSGNRIHLTRTQDASSPQVVETTVHGERRVISQTELLTSLQDSRGTPTLTPEAQEVNDALVDALKNADQAAADLKAQYPGVQVADARGGVPDTTAQNTANTNTLTNFLSAQGSSLTPAQQTALAAQVNSLGLGGEGDLSFYSLPGGGALIANADGEIVGEVHLNSATGSLNLRATGIDADGNAVEVSQHIQQNGDALTEGQYNAQVQQQAAHMFNSLMAVNNWDELKDLGKLSALANLYNATDKLGEAFNATGDNLPGDLGAAAGWLSLAQGLQSGDDLIIANGINVISDGALDSALNQAFGNTAAGQSVPYLSYALAIRNFAEDPVNAVFTAAGTYAGEAIGMALGGPIGAAIGGAIGGMIGGMLGGLFGGDDMPMREGLAHAQWDAHGQTQVITTQDAEGGGATASSWMNSLVSGLQTHLDQTVDANGQAQYGLVPGLLPSVGFKYDPDGFNLANGAQGFMYLQWTDENGQTQTRYYDGAGDRGDGSGETLAGDFMQHAQGAIAPAWQVQTVWAHYQQTGQLDLPEQSSSLLTELADGLQQTLQFVTLELGNTLPTETSANSRFIDVDGDGYLEQTQWLQSNQAVLAVDLNGDGLISVGERVNLQGGTQHDNARTSMGWLDANGDGRLTAQDPAFAALKLWIDVNQDGKSQNGEVQSISQAGITAMDFSTNPPSIERADGSRQTLTVQDLTADTLGVVVQSTAGGVLETTEQLGGTGASVLHAVNTRELDGQAAHTQGGGEDVDGSNGQVVQVDASRLATTTNHTIANSSKQTSTTIELGDSRLKSAVSTTAATAVSNNSAAVSHNNANNARVVFVPSGQISTHTELLRVTDNMIESAKSSLFGSIGASGLGGMGVLAAVSTGATVSAANAAEGWQRPVVVSNALDGNLAEALATSKPVSSSNTFTSTIGNTPIGTSTSLQAVSFTQVNLGVAAQPPQLNGSDPSSTSAVSTPSTIGPISGVGEGASIGSSTAPVFVMATVITSANSASASSNTNTTQAVTPVLNSAAELPGPAPLSLVHPQVQAETLTGTEDVVLRLTQTVLLANDRTSNASADPSQPAQSITAVSAPLHGQVSLVNGEVLFAPDTNFYGRASFTYTVTDQYGLSSDGTATLMIAAVNDVPVTQGESRTIDEDAAIVFTQAELLANDSDVDVGTDGQVLRISAVGGASNGTVTMQANGDVRFTPTANYHGPAEFSYVVSDGSGGTTDAKVSLSIMAVSDAPVAVGDVFAVTEDSTIVLTAQDLLGNDTDNDMATDADVLTITRVFAPQHCTVTLNADGTISLTPDANYHGNVRFSYEIKDTEGATSTAFVVAGVNAVNDAPVSYADGFASLEDQIVTLNPTDLLSNDTDDDIATDGDALRVATVSNATNGQVRLLPNGQIEFVPDNNFHGTATFDYVVSDSFGATSLSTVTLQVGAVNDAPVVVNETAPATEDTQYVTTATALLANDGDVDMVTDGQVLSITQVQNAQHGAVGMDVNGRITFTPDANFNGTASFEYVVSDGMGADGLRTGTVTLQVQAVNDVPVTQGESRTIDEDAAIVFTQAELLANDNDVDVLTNGQVLQISRVSNATHGTVALDALGQVRFVPDLNYHGHAEFTYWVSDGAAANGAGAETPATVNLTIAAVNDSPVVQGEAVATSEDTPLWIPAATLLANDSDADIATDGQVLSISAVSAIAGQTHGSVSLVTQAGGTQQVQFTPDANYHGVAKFNYTVSDGHGGFSTAVASVNIAAVNDAPVTQGESRTIDEDAAIVFTQAELLANDNDVDVLTDGQVLRISAVGGASNGTVTMQANGDVRFIPTANYHGPAEFSYVVSDGIGGTTDAKVSLAITAVNDAPVVVGETLTATEDTPFYIEVASLLSNDSDADTATDGQVLSISAVSAIAGQTHGSVSLVTRADGAQQVQFTPEQNFNGIAKFNYTVSDGHGGFSTAVATINMAAVNDAPVTQGETFSSHEDIGLIFMQAQLLANDSDVDVATNGQVLRISRVGQAEHGAVLLDEQGNLRFVPDANYHGAAKFTYWVSDGAGAETPATMNLIIAAVNDVPLVQGEATSTTEDTALSIDAATLLANDSDVDANMATDGQVLRISAVSNAVHCEVSLMTHADGTQRITFVPNANFHGTATFDYTVIDRDGDTAVATAVVNLRAVNDAPVTTGETASGDEDITFVFTSRELLANDTDVDAATDNQVLSISRVDGATHGTVTLDAQGQVHFTPDANYYGPAQFTYWVSDGLAVHGGGAETPATVSLTILAVNDLPLVTGETISRNEDTALLFNPAILLANDKDVDSATDEQGLVITNIGNAQNGRVAWAMQPDGSQYIAFTPERNFFGVASYQYTVSDGNGDTATTTVVINLAAVNDAPDVVADTFSATEDTPLTWAQASLLANDSDVDNRHTDLRIVGVNNATHGTVSLNANGSISFNPVLDYFGPATFNYTVADGAGGFSVGTATLNIAPVNDNPLAVGEIMTLDEDEIGIFAVASLLANDSDVETPNSQLNIQSVGNATNGSVSLVTNNGSTSVVFTPELNFNGTAGFTYTVSDGVGGTATTHMTLNFTPVNDVPVVNNELFQGKRNVSYSLSTMALLANDTDLETPNGLTVASVGNARHGTVSLLNGNVVFVPAAGYAGIGSFDYVVRDANGGQSTGTTRIDFSRVNVNPTAVNDSFTGYEDVPLTITQAQLLVNDSDSDNASTSLRVTHLGSATHGSVSFDAQGNVVFTPTANFNGQASFTYQVRDPDGGSTWATASLNVASVNDAPIIEDVWYGRPIYGYKWQANVTIDENGSYAGHAWTLVAVTSESEARSLVSNPSDVVYAAGLPPLAEDRSRSNDLMSATGVVLSPNYYQNGQLKPIAINSLDATQHSESGSTSVDDGYRQNGSVIAYDPDGDSSTITFSIGSTPTHGHAWVNQYTSLNAPEQLDHTQAAPYWNSQTGAWQYYSKRGDTYSGADGFRVSVTDSSGASTSVTVNATHKGSSPAGGGGKKPVTLDLNGDGLQYIGLDDSKAYFDVNDDGWRERMAWVRAGDGLLVLDAQGDHTIDKWNEISFVSYMEGARTDLEGLRAFDSSGNGKLDRLDARWKEFGAWVDANANGVCETGEFKTLDDLRIVSIDLTSDQNLATPVFGVTELGQSKFTTADGKTHAVGDVVFAVDAHDRLPNRAPDSLAVLRSEPVQEAALQKTDFDANGEVGDVVFAVDAHDRLPSRAPDELVLQSPESEQEAALQKTDLDANDEVGDAVFAVDAHDRLPSRSPDELVLQSPEPVQEAALQKTDLDAYHEVGDAVFAVDAHDRLPSRSPDELVLQSPEPGQAAGLQETNADGQLAEVIRQAMLFNQMVNTAIPSNEPPLSFVTNEMLAQDWRQIELQGAVDPFSAPRVSAS